MIICKDAKNFTGEELIGFLIASMECQNSCVFCGADKIGSGKHLDFKTAQTQLQDWRNYGAKQLIVSGGEPLQNPELKDILAFARELKYSKITLYTTANFEDTSFGLDVLKYVDIMMVSIFGKNEKKHDSIARNRGSFKKTIHGIIDSSKTDTKVSINTPVNRSNIDDLHQTMDLIESLPDNVFGWQLGDVHPTLEAKKRKNLRVSYVETGERVRSILCRARTSRLAVLTQEFPLCIISPWLLEAQELVKVSKEIFVSGSKYNSTLYDFVRPLSSRSKTYLKSCDECSLKGICKGISTSYAEDADIDYELNPIDELSVEALIQSASSRWSKVKADLGLIF